MNQITIRKRLSVLSLAVVMSVMALGFIVHARSVLDYPPGPTVAGIKLPDVSPLPYPPGPTLIGIKVPEGKRDIIAI